MSKTETDSSGAIRGHCPKCGPLRWADIAGAHKHDYYYDETGISGTVIHRILKCRGCDTVYFRNYEECSEDCTPVEDGRGGWNFEIDPRVQYWPSPIRRKRPDWLSGPFGSGIDQDLERLLDEVYSGFDADLRVLAAIGIRTVFDRASELLGIDPGVSFAEKLTKLVTAGKIGLDERDTLNVLVDAGSAAAHRGWRPSEEELHAMMDLIESFVYRSFLLGNRAKNLGIRVPSKPHKSKT